MDPEKALLHNGTSLSGEVRENIISDAIHIPPRAVSSKTCLSFYFCAIVWLNKTIFYMCFYCSIDICSRIWIWYYCCYEPIYINS
jgi:hypothetical protein